MIVWIVSAAPTSESIACARAGGDFLRGHAGGHDDGTSANGSGRTWADGAGWLCSSPSEQK